MPRVSKKDQTLENKFPKTDRFELSQESLAVDEELLNRLVSLHHSCAIGGDKTAQQFLQDNYTNFRESLGLYTLLITGIITPDECNEGESWGLIIHRRDKLINLLKTNYPDILFIVSGIEEHEGARKKSEDKDKSKIKSEEHEEENSDSENPVPVDLKPIKTKKSNKADIPKEETPIGKNYVWNVPYEARKSQVISCFSEHNEKLELSLASTEKSTLLRILNYGKTACSYPTPNRCEKHFVKTEELKSSDIELDIYSEIYENLFSTYGPKKDSKAKRKDLKGYAHLHMVLFLTTKSGKPIDIVQVNNLCRSNNIFIDITTKEDLNLSYENLKKKKAVVSKGNPLSYVLKNNRHRGSYIKLGHKNPCELHIIKENATVTNFFSNLVNTTGSKVILNGVDKTVKAPLSIPKPLELKQKVIGIDPIDEEHDVPIALTKQDIMINFVNSYLKKNDMAFGADRKIYKKVKGSKNTYEIYKVETDNGRFIDCDYVLFLAEMTGTNEGRKIFPASKSDYLFYAEMPNQRVFTRVMINCEWIEFIDFFVHIPTKRIFRGIPDWASFCFIKHSYTDYEKVKNHELKPENWLYLLQNSGYVDSIGNPIEVNETYNIELYDPKYQAFKSTLQSYTIDGQTLVNLLYHLLAPKRHKGKVPVLFGPPDCGKSTISSPFHKIFPISKIGTCSKANGFESSNFVGKQLMILDEFSMKNTGLDRSDLLQFMEGNTLKNINPKNQDPYTAVINTNIVMIGNKLDWASKHPQSPFEYEFVPEARIEVDSAYASRCSFFPFKSIPKSHKKLGVKEFIEREEKGLVFLYLLAFSNTLEIKEETDIETMRDIISNYNHNCELGFQ